MARQEKEFAVIGLGRLGSSLARRLEAGGNAVLGLEQDPVRAQDLADELTDVVILDATNEEALLEVDIASFETVVVAISGDLAASALIVHALKQCGIPRIICQAADSRQAEILRSVGADRVLRPYQESGERLADELSNREVLERMELGGDYVAARLAVSAHLSDEQVSLCENSGLTVLLIRRGVELIMTPDSSEKLMSGDYLVVVGGTHTLESFVSKL